LLVVNVPDIEEHTLSGQVDVGIHVTSRPLTTRVSSQPAFDDDFVCLVRRDHPRIGAKLTLESYLAERHVVVAPTGTAGSVVDTALEKMGLERRVAARVTNFLVAPIVVAETDFLSTMPRLLGIRLGERYALRTLEPPLSLPPFGFVLIWHPRLDADPAQLWLRQLFARVCRGLPPLPKLTGRSRRRHQ
jgi:DNA-binding transcriptional LysR family regulator